MELPVFCKHFKASVVNECLVAIFTRFSRKRNNNSGKIIRPNRISQFEDVISPKQNSHERGETRRTIFSSEPRAHNTESKKYRVKRALKGTRQSPDAISLLPPENILRTSQLNVAPRSHTEARSRFRQFPRAKREARKRNRGGGKQRCYSPV